MRACAQCGQPVERGFRFCPWCAAPQRLKLVEFFRGREYKALRVSRYLDEDPQVRFSIWDENLVAQAAVSIDEDEAARLAHFLLPATRARGVAARVRALASRL